MNLLSIKKLHFLHCGPIELKLKATEIIGLSGASGSGKSLFLRALADLDAHQGEIRLDEFNQQDIQAHLWRQKVALLSADTSWWFDTVGEHFSAQFMSDSTQQLEALGFKEGCWHWSIARLSSGEKQRLGLLRLLQNQPEVLLLDEPTANLDKHNTQLFENFVKKYLQEKSACAIWVGHNSEQLQRISQRNYVIDKGVLANAN